MADLVFIVSRTEPKQYFHLRHAFADKSRDVVLDRRISERRLSLRPPPGERRRIDRRRRDVTRELQSSGWALVRRTDDATRCVEPGCHEEGVVGLNGAWLCLTHFEIRFSARRKAATGQTSSSRMAS
jgi:hypothetical protein